MNYATLVETIQAYTENDFPDTAGSGGLTSAEQTATFIQQAEQRIYNNVQLLELRKNVTGNATATNKYLSVPTDWLANFSLAVIDPTSGAYDYLLNKDVNYIREAFPYPATTGKPTHYAMFDQNSYLLGPTPDASYNMELHYFYYPQSIVTASTSWLGDNFSSVLLYGSLLEAYTFMKGEQDVLGGYQKRYEEALAQLKELGEGKNRQDMYRTPQIRFPVR
jgi:hypothetical protein